MRWFALCSFAVALGACAEPAVEILGECHPASREVELALDPGERLTAVGLIDEHVLVTTVIPVAPDDPDGEWLVDVRARWLDGSFSPVGDPIVLGRWRDVPAAGRTRWQRVGDALVGQVMADPRRSRMQPHDVDLVHVWTMRPPPEATAERAQVDVPVRQRLDGTGELWLSGLLYSGLHEMASPAALVDGRVVHALIGVPNVCTSTDDDAVLLFRESGGGWSGAPVQPGEEGCALPAELRSPAVPWLVALPGGGAGLLFRRDVGRDGHVQWLRLSSDLRPLGTAVRVGGGSPYQTDFGGQPRAFAFDDGHVVMAERPVAHDRCRSFRVFDVDGSDAHDGPWKLPCSDEIENEFGAPLPRRITQFLEIEPIADRGAVVVYTDVRNRDWPGGSEPTVVRAALLTSRGQRGSETLDLSDPGGPAVSSLVLTATDGDRGVALWAAGGVPRARLFTCSLHD